MPTYDLDGVSVDFPHEAYDCQLDYMRAVVRGLENGENALLESPTGTGKTLCLLCASLGWRRHRQQVVEAAKTSWEAQAEGKGALHVPTIFYSSRTHTQLKQVMRELKGTSYKPSSVVLGSRQHFCLHTSVQRHSGARQNAMCRRVVDEHRCPFYTGFRKCGSKVSTALQDIEEIVESCREATVCPYFKVREDAKEADLLLLPYDYLISAQSRDSMQVSLKNSILIFDEGHNIERSCEENASFELTQADIAGAIGELEDAFDLVERGEVTDEVLKDTPCEVFLKHVNLVKKHLFALEDAISAQVLEQDAATERLMCKASGSRIWQLLAQPGTRGIATEKEDLKHITQLVRRAADVLTRGQETLNSGGQYLEKIQQLLLTAFQHEKEDLDKNYQLLIYEDVEKKGQKRKAVDFFTVDGTREDGQAPRKLCLWCFSCSVAMKDLQKHEVHSVIITSGTLSPMNSTAEAFGVPFPIILENRHVIDPGRQLFGALLSKGPNEVSLDAAFSHRTDAAYIKELGATVKSLAGSVPDGLLLAFSSYGMKETILEAWRRQGILQDIAMEKPLFDEPKGNHETKEIMEKYNSALLGPSGAILAAVCRGKLCEGIDFTDKQCRMVVLVGIPYPAKNDLRVILKQDFLNRHREGQGQGWYQREAMRAVNQTLGRVIRHRKDYGAVVLCDARFAGRLAGLSTWMRPQVRHMNLQSAIQDCRHFFGRPQVEVPGERDHVKEGMAATPMQTPVASVPVAARAEAPKKSGEQSHGQKKEAALNRAREIWRSGKAQGIGTSEKSSIRRTATPQVSMSQPIKGDMKYLTQASPFQPLAVRQESEWLKSAETLLPRMAMMELKQHLELLLANTSDAMEGRDDAMTEVTEALRACAVCLLPVMNFDRPEEARKREVLVQTFPSLLPKLLRNLWKEEATQAAKASVMQYKIAAVSSK